MPEHLKSNQSSASSPSADDDVICWEDEDADASQPVSPGAIVSGNSAPTHEPWFALIVDDEPDVHQATRLALQGFQFEGRPLQWTSAYSGQDGRVVLEKQSEIAVVLLDVVMEHTNAGLELVRFIREELGNRQVRIILRTGQPGEAPESDAILSYDINDYQLKVDVTRQRLMTTMIGALRSFRDISLIERQRADLEISFHRLQQLQRQLKIYSQDLELQVAKRTAELRAANEKLQRLVNIDGLTQIANRRYFDQYLAERWQQALQSKEPLCLILLDVDYFKNYNDRYGHQAGDDCLKRVASLLAQNMSRPLDLVARYGGEEFVIVLPATSDSGGCRVSQAIFQALEAECISHDSSLVSDRITLSAGISWVVPQKTTPPNILVETADRALYRAKQLGRNRYHTYTSTASQG